MLVSVAVFFARAALVEANLRLLHRGRELCHLRRDARQRCRVLRQGCRGGGDLRREGTLLCDECVERLLLGEGVIERVSANRSSLCQAEANNKERDGEQDAESGAPGTLLLRRRVLHL